MEDNKNEPPELVSISVHDEIGLNLLPTDIAGPYYRALGELSVSHSALHFSVERALWRIACRDDVSGNALTRDLQFGALFRKYCIIAEARVETSDDKKTLRQLENESRRLSEERNKLIHSLWIMEDGRPISRYNRRVALSEPTFPTVEEITNITKAIARLSADFFAFDYDCFK